MFRSEQQTCEEQKNYKSCLPSKERVQDLIFSSTTRRQNVSERYKHSTTAQEWSRVKTRNLHTQAVDFAVHKDSDGHTRFSIDRWENTLRNGTLENNRFHTQS